jgi:DNA-binding CsgD family transcriptional regulator
VTGRNGPAAILGLVAENRGTAAVVGATEGSSAAADDREPRFCPAGRPGERPLLSPRERECLQWTAAGKTTWEIAAILEISPNTIDGYVAAATRKLGAVNRTQAVAEALRRGLID